MDPVLDISLDRTAKRSLAEQISGGLSVAIADGRLPPGARLPSWRDLAAQLGVARGTVRAAYDRLIDAELIVTSGAAGTRVADRPPISAPEPDADGSVPFAGLYSEFSVLPGPFKMGVPAQDAFPFKLWSRVMARAARAAAAAPANYPDPRGEPELRREIAAYLAIARGIACTPSQILVTAGYAGALGLVVRALGLEGGGAWIEEPGYPLMRAALTLARVTATTVPVDRDGLDVAAGLARAPQAAFAIVTPGQQAPLGVTMSPARRQALLDWAEKADGWIVEDDYLSELQLKGRAAPALASRDRLGRVIHIGTFSKTISPALRLGFVVVPPALAARFGEAAACFAPAQGATVQRAVTEFLRDGHYLRHLRRMKRLYAARRDALIHRLGGAATSDAMAGLAVLLPLPDGTPDTEIAQALQAQGLAPAPLSLWYADAGSQRSGLLLGVTNLVETRLDDVCTRLERVLGAFL